MRAVTAALLCLIVALPFIRFQLYAHDLYCIAKNSGQTMSRERRPWCVEDGMSNLYAFVQREYWNQGPFRYWTLKQIPNFLLAAPVLLLSAAMAFHYKSARTGDMNIEPLEHITMLERLVGFDADTKMVATSEPAQCDGDDDDDDANQKTRRFPALTKSSVFESRKTAAFVWHCAALSVLMLICFHVQVATRFLFAASPALYWYVADLVERHGENSWAAHIVLGYFCVYFILGATLFSTFYPWT
jgi:phosphatidylinositol glycan class V